MNADGKEKTGVSNDLAERDAKRATRSFWLLAFAGLMFILSIIFRVMERGLEFIDIIFAAIWVGVVIIAYLKMRTRRAALKERREG